MSDVKNLYKLKQPVTKKFYIDGENNIDENCIDVGFQIFSIGAFEQYFERLDVESLTTQLENLLAPFIFMSQQEGYFHLDNDDLFAKLNTNNDTKVVVAEVLELIGMTTKDKK